MTRDEFESLGNKHKQYEQLNKQFLIPNLPIVARVDGKSFHTFTKDLQKPYDINFTSCMHSMAKTILDKFNGYISYVQSDECTIIIPGNESEVMFGGNKDKLVSLIAATASVSFFKALETYLPEKKNTLPVFDCRVFQYPNKNLYAENLIWREEDTTRNSLSMLCSSHFSNKMLFKANRERQHEMLHSIGINWSDYASCFKRGTYYAKRKVEDVISDEIWNKIPEKNRPESKVFYRSSIVDLNLPPAKKIKNFVGVIFDKESPIVD